MLKTFVGNRYGPKAGKRLRRLQIRDGARARAYPGQSLEIKRQAGFYFSDKSNWCTIYNELNLQRFQRALALQTVGSRASARCNSRLLCSRYDKFRPRRYAKPAQRPQRAG